MRVNDNNMSGIGASGLNRTKGADGVERQGSAGAAGRTGSAGGDEVRLSDLAENLQSLSAKLEAAEAGSPERMARLEQLKSVVASGRYEPDAEAISQSLMDEMEAERL